MLLIRCTIFSSDLQHVHDTLWNLLQVTCKTFLASCHSFFKNLAWCSWSVLTSSSTNMQDVPNTLHYIPQVTCKLFPIRSQLSVKAVEIQSWYVVTSSYSYDWMKMSWWSSLSHMYKPVEVMFKYIYIYFYWYYITNVGLSEPKRRPKRGTDHCKIVAPNGSNNWDANIANAVVLLTPVAPRGGGLKVVTSVWAEFNDMFVVRKLNPLPGCTCKRAYKGKLSHDNLKEQLRM